MEWIPPRIRARLTVEDRGYYEGPCWIVSGWDDGKGHKKIRWWGICTFVHRVVWCIFHNYTHHDEINGVLDHLCRNPACCKPAHLEDVTVKVNTDRGLGANNQFKRPDDYSGATSWAA